MSENIIEFLRGEETATVTFSQGRYISRIRELKERFPDQVEITDEPETNGGYLVAHVPTKWIRVSPPPQREYTEEQLEAMRERFAAVRKSL